MPICIPELQTANKKDTLGGIYIISTFKRDQQNFRCKIGMSINSKRRLNGYHICFPKGFFIYGLWTITKDQLVKGRNRERYKQILKMEKEFHQTIKQYRMADLLSGSREWYEIPVGVAQKKLKAFVAGKKIGTLHKNLFSVARRINEQDFVIDGIDSKEIQKFVDKIDKQVEYVESRAKPTRIMPERQAKLATNLIRMQLQQMGHVVFE